MNYVAHADAAEGLVAEIIAAGGRAIAAMADVAEAATVEMMVARAEKQLGPVTVLRPVEIHREFITAAARWMMAAKL